MIFSCEYGRRSEDATMSGRRRSEDATTSKVDTTTSKVDATMSVVRAALGVVLVWFLGFGIGGCITDYEATGVHDEKNILVVEGVITEGETVIALSRSLNLTDASTVFNYINDAIVYVECDDGTQILAERTGTNNGQYTIRTGMLNLDCKYRLRLAIEEDSEDCITVEGQDTPPCPKKTFEYVSDYTYPIATPEIDSIFWSKRGLGEPVLIHVATHDPQSRVLYYRWSYKEEWEIHSDVAARDFFYPYFCWNQAKNPELLLGSSEKTVFGQLTDILVEVSPFSRKLEVLYRITVDQNVISKRAFDYYENIKKNIQQSSSIFAPVPSELRGNISCLTEPGRPVIGYVDVSLTTQKQIFIKRADGAFENSLRGWDCDGIPEDTLLFLYDGIPPSYVPYEWRTNEIDCLVLDYILNQCIDCTLFGTTEKIDDWP